MDFVVKAYAKVNLHLEVLNRRTDGYHNIFSLMASIDLFDLLKLKSIKIFDESERDISVEIVPDGGDYAEIIEEIPIKDNLITRAAIEYFRNIGKTGSVSFLVKKNIPAGAGLAGGSSDAASVLRLLNEYLGMMDLNELNSTAAAIGADVPFCLYGGYAICEGIGEKVERLNGRLEHWVLIANDGIHLNTGDAYNALGHSPNRIYSEDDLEGKRRLFKDGIRTGELERFRYILKNDFEPVIFSRYPRIKEIKDLIAQFNPIHVAMTGSGSSVIGLFTDFDSARRSESYLAERVKSVYLTRFI